jgi:chromosome segregation ATPase
VETPGQRASILLGELEEELASKDRVIEDLRRQLEERPRAVAPMLIELFEEEQLHVARARELVQKLESVSAPTPPAAIDGDARQLRQQLESERQAHQEQAARLVAELEQAREAAAGLDAVLMEQRGALQRIEAKFNLYAAAVTKIAEPPARRGPKLLTPSKQVPPRRAKADGLAVP